MSNELDWGSYLDHVESTLDVPDPSRLAGMTPEEVAELPFFKFRDTLRAAYLRRKADALIRAHEYGDQKLVLSTEADIRNRPSPEWLVADLIQENTIALLAGPGGLGKSFLALSLARSIACGSPFFGKQTRRGRVLYVVAEGAAAFGDRVDAWDEAHPSLKVPGSAITYVEAGVNLQVEESLEQLRTLIRDGEYDLVILDTLNQLAYFENENNNAEAGTVFRNIQSLRMVREGTSILVLDHTPAGGGKARGATAKRDNSDTVIMAIPVEAEDPSKGFSLSTANRHNGKQKDGAELTWHGFSLASKGRSAVVVNNNGKRPESKWWPPVLAVLADGQPHKTKALRDACGIQGDMRSADGKRFKRELDYWVEEGLVEVSGSTSNMAYTLAEHVAAVSE